MRAEQLIIDFFHEFKADLDLINGLITRIELFPARKNFSSAHFGLALVYRDAGNVEVSVVLGGSPATIRTSLREFFRHSHGASRVSTEVKQSAQDWLLECPRADSNSSVADAHGLRNPTGSTVDPGAESPGRPACMMRFRHSSPRDRANVLVLGLGDRALVSVRTALESDFEGALERACERAGHPVQRRVQWAASLSPSSLARRVLAGYGSGAADRLAASLPDEQRLAVVSRGYDVIDQHNARNRAARNQDPGTSQTVQP